MKKINKIILRVDFNVPINKEKNKILETERIDIMIGRLKG